MPKFKRIFRGLLYENKNIISFFYFTTIRLKKKLFNFFLKWDKNYPEVLLGLIIIIALFIKVPYVKFGLPYVHNWDEPAIVNKAITIMQTGDLNPHYFHYPSLTTYIQLPFFVLNYYRLVSAGKINSIQDIELRGRTISHPSFYAVSRLTMVFLSVLSIFMLFQIGKRYFNMEVGLLAALIMTFLAYDLEDLKPVSPNQTVSFFVLLTLFFLSLYLKKKKSVYILLTGLACGLATASKYNAFLVSIPIILGILFFSKKKWRDITLLLPSSAFGFFIGCPYALFDMNTFLEHTGIEIRHYKAGHKDYEGPPGLFQFKFYLNEFKTWIHRLLNFKSSWISPVLGAIAYAFRDFRGFVTVFSFPFFYLIYMSQQRVHFIRNMICMIPFLSLFIGIIFHYIYKLFIRILKYASQKRWIRLKINDDFVFIIAFLVILSLFNPFTKIKEALEYLKTYKESRTMAVEYIRENFPEAKIGISKELGIHPLDLEKIRNREIFNAEKVSLPSLYRRKFDYIISSDKYKTFYNKEGDEKRIELLKKKFPRKNIIKSFGLNRVRLDIFSVDPVIHIYKVDKSFLNGDKD